ncbi:MAG TPA: hypothetical protein VEZ11_10435 [Thermoanaerobaculia bacterium]|nr:hypothetical protein [Thermoanaerobaculia bacterium]
MALDPLHSDDVDDQRIVSGRSRRTGEAVSNLCSAWLRAGADMLVGSINVAGTIAEDFTDSYCDRLPRKQRDD